MPHLLAQLKGITLRQLEPHLQRVGRRHCGQHCIGCEHGTHIDRVEADLTCRGRTHLGVPQINSGTVKRRLGLLHAGQRGRYRVARAVVRLLANGPFAKQSVIALTVATSIFVRCLGTGHVGPRLF